MRRSGFTLIELMISVALVGILSTAAGVRGGITRELGFAELQRERALILLEYQASCAATGAPVADAVRERLSAGLPRLQLTEEVSALSTTFGASWRDPFDRPVHRDLTVFVPRGAP